jgi:hypothetical protein
MMRASKNIDDQTDRSNEMDLISTNSLVSLFIGALWRVLRRCAVSIHLSFIVTTTDLDFWPKSYYLKAIMSVCLGRQLTHHL